MNIKYYNLTFLLPKLCVIETTKAFYHCVGLLHHQKEVRSYTFTSRNNKFESSVCDIITVKRIR